MTSCFSIWTLSPVSLKSLRQTARNSAHRPQAGDQAGRPSQHALIQPTASTHHETTESDVILLISGSLKHTTTLLNYTTATTAHGLQTHSTKTKIISNTTSRARANNTLSVQGMNIEILPPDGKHQRPRPTHHLEKRCRSRVRAPRQMRAGNLHEGRQQKTRQNHGLTTSFNDKPEHGKTTSTLYLRSKNARRQQRSHKRHDLARDGTRRLEVRGKATLCEAGSETHDHDRHHIGKRTNSNRAGNAQERSPRLRHITCLLSEAVRTDPPDDQDNSKQQTNNNNKLGSSDLDRKARY